MSKKSTIRDPEVPDVPGTIKVAIGMVRSLTLDYEKDLGRLFENVVYLDLRRQGYEVS